MRLRESGINIYKAKVAAILIVFVMVGVLICNRAYSQGSSIRPGNIHLGPLKISPSLSEGLEYDDNAFQVSGKGVKADGRREEKQSDIINKFTPGIKLDLPFKGGGFIPGTEHNLSIDWKTEYLNYRDNAKQNQENINGVTLVSLKILHPRSFAWTTTYLYSVKEPMIEENSNKYSGSHKHNVCVFFTLAVVKNPQMFTFIPSLAKKPGRGIPAHKG